MANENKTRDYADPSRRADLDRDMNRDPITDEPGAHPVGAGVGAAAGGTVGGVVGSLAGPIGTAVGATIGGVIGGLAGKGTAEAINPTAEVDYWRGQYATRPYGQGRRFEDLEPAYRSTVETYAASPSSTWESAEPTLRERWTTNRGKSTLQWDDVRGASKDAWDRVAQQNKGRVSDREEDAAEEVNDLMALLHDGANGFRMAAEKVENPTFRDGLLKFAAEREQFINELKPLVAVRGETPRKTSSVMGAVHRGWLGLRAALTSGDHAVLSECERGEDAAVAAYQKALEDKDVTPQFREILNQQYTKVRRAHDTVKMWRDSLA